MSLEDKITALTTALDKNTAALEAFVSKAGEAKASTGKGSTASKKSSISPEDLRTVVGDYIAEHEDADDKKVRSKKVKAALAKLGAAKASEITDGPKRDKMKEYVEGFKKGEVHEDLKGTDADDEDDESSLV